MTFTNVVIDVPPSALPFTTSDQVSATSRALRTVAFTSSTSHDAVVVAPLLLVAGAPMVAVRPSGSGVYASMMIGGVAHASVN